MSGGFRSRLGFWFGGLSKGSGSPPPPSNAGHRSRVGFWFGGMSAPGSTVPPDTIGFPSYFCPWLGGISSLGGVLAGNHINGSMADGRDSMSGLILLSSSSLIAIDPRFLFEAPER